MWLEKIASLKDLSDLDHQALGELCEELRETVVSTVTQTGGHLGSNLGVVELSVALHRVFESPKDILLFDTGHQAYVHKLLTGRLREFHALRSEGGISGYPKRSESEHDWIENSHASTALSYAHGLASSLRLGRGPLQGSNTESQDPERRVVAVVGDGALTGGMAYEALNNIGHSNSKVLIVWNDNGRSYAPTISRLSQSLTKLRLHPSYMSARSRLRQVITDLPAVGGLAASSIAGLANALREAIEPRVFFETLGVRYTGPIDGHDIAEMEYAFQGAKEWDGPIVVHVLTQKGHGYGPAEDDEIQCLHDLKIPPVRLGDSDLATQSYTETFSRKIVEIAELRPEVVAITAAMPSPTGLLPFSEKFPSRFFDVGIAEQHAVTAAAGMAMGGLRPVVAIYSTFMSRAFDQVNLDVGLHNLPVCFIIDRAGITGDDGPSHHGVLDLIQMLSVPSMTVFAPSATSELETMLDCALSLPGPSTIRFPKTLGPARIASGIGQGLTARRILSGDGRVCLIPVGKLVVNALEAAELLRGDGVEVTLWDPRVIRPLDPELIEDAKVHSLIVSIEDGFVPGGAGSHISFALSSVGSQVPFVQLGLPVRYISQGRADQILAESSLDGVGLARTISSLLENISQGLHISPYPSSPL